MEFGEKLRSLRIKAGLTQLDIAEKLDVSAAAIGAWENGRAKPRLTKLGQLAELLGTSAADLMGETPEPVRPNGAQYVTLPVLVAGHAGEFTDEFGPDEVADVPISVLERVNDPDAYLMRVRGSCMNRRFADGENALLSPRCEPRNGDAVAAEYNGEMILRSYYRGASTLVLSPDSYEDGYTDIVFDDPTDRWIVVRWRRTPVRPEAGWRACRRWAP